MRTSIRLSACQTPRVTVPGAVPATAAPVYCLKAKRTVTHIASAAVENSSSETPTAWVTQPYQLPAQPPLNDPQSRINAAKQLLEGARQAPSISNLQEVFDTLDDRGLLTMAHVLVCLTRLATLRQQQQLAAGGDAMQWQAVGEQELASTLLVRIQPKITTLPTKMLASTAVSALTLRVTPSLEWINTFRHAAAAAITAGPSKVAATSMEAASLEAFLQLLQEREEEAEMDEMMAGEMLAEADAGAEEQQAIAATAQLLAVQQEQHASDAAAQLVAEQLLAVQQEQQHAAAQLLAVQQKQQQLLLAQLQQQQDIATAELLYKLAQQKEQQHKAQAEASAQAASAAQAATIAAAAVPVVVTPISFAPAIVVEEVKAAPVAATSSSQRGSAASSSAKPSSSGRDSIPGRNSTKVTITKSTTVTAAASSKATASKAKANTIPAAVMDAILADAVATAAPKAQLLDLSLILTPLLWSEGPERDAEHNLQTVAAMEDSDSALDTLRSLMAHANQLCNQMPYALPAELLAELSPTPSIGTSPAAAFPSLAAAALLTSIRLQPASYLLPSPSSLHQLVSELFANGLTPVPGAVRGAPLNVRAVAIAAAHCASLGSPPSHRQLNKLLALLSPHDAALPVTELLSLMGMCLATDFKLSKQLASRCAARCLSSFTELGSASSLATLINAAAHSGCSSSDINAEQLALVLNELRPELSSLSPNSLLSLLPSLTQLMPRASAPLAAWTSSYCTAILPHLREASDVQLQRVLGALAAFNHTPPAMLMYMACGYAEDHLTSTSDSQMTISASSAVALLRHLVLQLNVSPLSATGEGLAGAWATYTNGASVSSGSSTSGNGRSTSGLTSSSFGELPVREMVDVLHISARLGVRMHPLQLTGLVKDILEASTKGKKQILSGADTARLLWACVQFRFVPAKKLLSYLLERLVESVHVHDPSAVGKDGKDAGATPPSGSLTMPQLALAMRSLTQLGCIPSSEKQATLQKGIQSGLASASVDTLSLLSYTLLELGSKPTPDLLDTFVTACGRALSLDQQQPTPQHSQAGMEVDVIRSVDDVRDSLASAARILHFVSATEVTPSREWMDSFFLTTSPLISQALAHSNAATASSKAGSSSSNSSSNGVSSMHLGDISVLMLRSLRMLMWQPPAAWSSSVTSLLLSHSRTLMPASYPFALSAVTHLTPAEEGGNAALLQALMNAVKLRLSEFSAAELGLTLDLMQPMEDAGCEVPLDWQVSISAKEEQLRVKERAAVLKAELKAARAGNGEDSDDDEDDMEDEEPARPDLAAAVLRDLVPGSWLAAALGEGLQ